MNWECVVLKEMCKTLSSLFGDISPIICNILEHRSLCKGHPLSKCDLENTSQRSFKCDLVTSLRIYQPGSRTTHPPSFPPTLKEKARKPRGKGEGDADAAPAPAEGEAGGGGGKASGAAQAALDAMEQLVNTLAHGKEEMEWERDEILSKVCKKLSIAS